MSKRRPIKVVLITVMTCISLWQLPGTLTRISQATGGQLGLPGAPGTGLSDPMKDPATARLLQMIAAPGSGGAATSAQDLVIYGSAAHAQHADQQRLKQQAARQRPSAHHKSEPKRRKR